MAECHPVAFQWVVEAKRRGATIIHVDPRFTRTSALADLHVPTRAGGDIVFLGALINHVLSGGHEFREYVTAYTNAADILPEDYVDAEDGDGLFSGYDPATRSYDNATWQPTGERDVTLTHPRCVFQVLKRHFARYTPELVEQVCGISPGRLRPDRRDAGRVQRPGAAPPPGSTRSAGPSTPPACSTSGPRPSCRCCSATWAGPAAASWRCAGTPASRAPPTSPPCSTCSPGYLPMPRPDDVSLEHYLTRLPDTGFWGNKRAYLVSLLKAWFGDAATAENDFCFGTCRGSPATTAPTGPSWT